MKRPSMAILMLFLAGIVLAIAAPLSIYSSGSNAVTGWSDAVRPGPLSKSHAFLNDECESCHTAVKGVTATKCATCHAFPVDLLLRRSTAFHANVQTCSGCHVEHQRAGDRPIKMDHSVLEKVARKSAGRPAALDCVSCHTIEDVHQTFFGKECASCHLTTTWEIAKFQHPSAKSTQCAQCHKPPPSHSMMHFEMVSQRVARQEAPVARCYSCHTTDSWNNIKNVGWYDHH